MNPEESKARRTVDSTVDGALDNVREAALDGDKLRHLHHQFNQPLTAISNYAQAGCCLIDQGMGDAAQLRTLFEKISVQSARANGLSQQLGEELMGGRGREPNRAPAGARAEEG